jgi:hypothetical protein
VFSISTCFHWSYFHVYYRYELLGKKLHSPDSFDVNVHLGFCWFCHLHQSGVWHWLQFLVCVISK